MASSAARLAAAITRQPEPEPEAPTTSAGKLAAAIRGDSTASTDGPEGGDVARLASLVRAMLGGDKPTRTATYSALRELGQHADKALRAAVYDRLKGRQPAQEAEAEPEPSTTSAGRLGAALNPEPEAEAEPRFRYVNGGITAGSRGKHGGVNGAGEPERPLSTAEQHAAGMYEGSPDRLYRARFGLGG